MSEERSIYSTSTTPEATKAEATPEATPEANNVTSTRTLQSGKRVKRLIMNMDEDLHKELRREALERDQSLTSYVTEILLQR